MDSVTARPAAGRSVDTDTFTDLTDAAVVDVSWESDGWLRVTFDRDLTVAESTAVRRRLLSKNADDEAVRAQAETFLDLTSPTCPEVVAHLKLLTRLALGDTEQPPAR